MDMKTTCPTCYQEPANPYRRQDKAGKIFEGCVNAFHNGHLYGESENWHERPEAKKIRAKEKAHLDFIRKHK